MKSLLISGSYFPPQVGGISTMMAEVCVQLGEQAAVFTAIGGDVQDPRLAGLRVYRAEGMMPPRTRSREVRLLAHLAFVLAKERPSILQYATLEDAYVAYWTSKALRLKHIVYAHGNEILGAASSKWRKTRGALMAASCVVANSRFTERVLKDQGVPSERIKVVHPGCDLTHFRRVPVPRDTRASLTRGRPDSRLLLTVGNLVERKGHDTVMRALALLANRVDVTYVIAGDGPHRPALQALAPSLGIAERVVFLGRVRTEELPLLYSAADAFIMISRDRLEHCDVEGFGIVFIEAAACGTPSIGGRSGGIADAVVDGVTGLLVDPNDPGCVAESIGSLLSSPELARRLGEAARQRAAREFSWQHFGNSIRTILSEAAAAG